MANRCCHCHCCSRKTRTTAWLVLVAVSGVASILTYFVSGLAASISDDSPPSSALRAPWLAVFVCSLAALCAFLATASTRSGLGLVGRYEELEVLALAAFCAHAAILVASDAPRIHSSSSPHGNEDEEEESRHAVQLQTLLAALLAAPCVPAIGRHPSLHPDKSSGITANLMLLLAPAVILRSAALTVAVAAAVGLAATVVWKWRPAHDPRFVALALLLFAAAWGTGLLPAPHAWLVALTTACPGLGPRARTLVPLLGLLVVVHALAVTGGTAQAKRLAAAAAPAAVHAALLARAKLQLDTDESRGRDAHALGLELWVALAPWLCVSAAALAALVD